MEETRYGATAATWQRAREQMAAVLADVARRGATITYTDLVARVDAMRLDPHDYAVATLLGEIAKADYEEGRGMRSALVVSKNESLPGAGFFALARQLGEDVPDEMAFWVAQLKQVHADYARHA